MTSILPARAAYGTPISYGANPAGVLTMKRAAMRTLKRQTKAAGLKTVGGLGFRTEAEAVAYADAIERQTGIAMEVFPLYAGL